MTTIDDLIQQHDQWCQSVSDEMATAKQEMESAPDDARQILDDALQDQSDRAKVQAGPTEQDDDDLIRELRNSNGEIDCRYLTQQQAMVVIRNLDNMETIPARITFEQNLAAIVLQEPVPEYENAFVAGKAKAYNDLKALHRHC